MKHIVVRQTITADYFEVVCSTEGETEGAAKLMAIQGGGNLVTTHVEQEWLVVGGIPEVKKSEPQDRV